MKPFTRPPTFQEVVQKLGPERLAAVLQARITATPHGRYYHWEKLRHLEPPGGLSHEEWWAGVKFARMSMRRSLPLSDASSRNFTYALIDPMHEMLHKIDQQAAGKIAISDHITNPDTRDRYIFSSLIEEAVTSSQLEGASTTRQVAANMIRSGRKPRDKSEQMIFNNYAANKHIRTFTGKSLEPADVLNLHRILTVETLDDPDSAGRLQTPNDERVVVVDELTHRVLHEPPPASQLDWRLTQMCRFANGEISDGFLHPIIRAIMLHFWLAYDHPFVDGNGRTARALFYWSMLSSGYWLIDYVSISTVLKTAYAKYGNSYLYAESDENDATYFIVYQLEVLLRAIKQLEVYIEAKIQQIQAVESRLRGRSNYNHRQLALLGHALRHPESHYSVKSHQRSHNVAYATARSDLLTLAKDGLLASRRIGGKTLDFVSLPDLDSRIESLH